MVMVRRISPQLEARQMPLYPTAEECHALCDWIAQDLGSSDEQLNDYGVGKDPVTGLVQLKTPYGDFLIGLGHWVIRKDEGKNFLVVKDEHFQAEYEIIPESEIEHVPEAGHETFQ